MAKTEIVDGKIKKPQNPKQAMYIREVSKGKKPVKINRQPVPPRVPTGKYEMPDDEMRVYEKKKGPTLAETFEEA